MGLVLSFFDARVREGVLSLGLVFAFEHRVDGCGRCERVAGCDENEKSIGSWFEGTEYVSTGGIAGMSAIDHTRMRHR